MMKLQEELEETIKNLDVEQAEVVIESQLKYNYNIDLLLKLAVTVLCVPLVDYNKSLACVKNVYEIDENNFQAIILECCIHYYHLGGIDSELFSKLNRINNVSDKDLSIVKYVMSWYYENNDIKNYMLCLQESTNLCKEYVENYKDLGLLYLKQGQISKGLEYLKKALSNIQQVYSDDIHDFTSVQEYFDEMITGIRITSIGRNSIKEIILKNAMVYYK